VKNTITAASVHKQYDEGVSAFKRLIEDATVRVILNQSVDPFMRKCAKGVWKETQHISPAHVEYHNAIYCRGNSVPSVLYWELVRQVDEFSGFELPDFFRKLVNYDLEKGDSISRRFIDLFTLMMLLFASVDGVVSENEAGFINHCADSMTAFCNRAGVKGGTASLNTEEFITRDSTQDLKSGAAPHKIQKAESTSEEENAEKEKGEVPKETLEELLAELDDLCGLEKVKADVKSLINLIKVRKLREDAGLPVPPISLHLVFMGNPGTGKTTVARLLAKIYHAIGVLSKGQLVEVDRSGLVAGFVGQTALKTGEVIQKALGGVLFIDEAYALANHENANDFGQEAIETLLKAMEDHRADLIVIVAGYTDLMEHFINSNPGLESRFNKYFYFEDYTGTQLAEIFRSICIKNGYKPDDETNAAIEKEFVEFYVERDENFGNARDVRNIFEKAVACQANRIAQMENPNIDDLMTLKKTDFEFWGTEEGK